MAKKRMFDKRVIDSDAFLEMPLTTQAVYFHLNMRADDDGFVDNYKSILRLIGGKEDDLKVLISKKFIIPFEKGIIVITHWKINNLIRKDRYIETIYKEEKALLNTDSNGEYTLGIPMVDQRLTQYSIEENSKVELSIEENSIDNMSRNLDAESTCDDLSSHDTTLEAEFVESKTQVCKKVIDYLNSKIGTRYQYQNKSTQSKIKARLNEGHSLDDFIVVIDKMCVEWANDEKMRVYLRPETLFGNKFESYLNRPAKKITTKDLKISDEDLNDFFGIPGKE